MRNLLDPLFLRRPKIDYISPAICEVLFSATGHPIIVLNPILKKKGPTGLIIGGRGHIRLTWNNFPGALCYNIYRADIIASLGPCGCADVLDLIAECVQSGGIEINDYGCYYVTAITGDGESEPSDPICFNNTTNPPVCPPGTIYNPSLHSCVCPALVCPPGQSWDFNLCQCVPCPVQTCAPGFHWDAATCACVPDGGCSAFIEDITPLNPPSPYIPGTDPFSNPVTIPRVGGFWGGTRSDDGRPAFYFNHILQYLDSVGAIHPGNVGCITAANASRQVGGMQLDGTGLRYDVFWLDIPNGIVRNVGPADNPGGLTSPIKILANGKMLMGCFAPIVTDGCSIYNPNTDTLTNHLTVPASNNTGVFDWNEAEVMCGVVYQLFTDVAVSTTMTVNAGSLLATNVVLPAAASGTVGDLAARINSSGSVVGFWFDGVNGQQLYFSGGVKEIPPLDPTFQTPNTLVFLNDMDEVAFTMQDQNTGFHQGAYWKPGTGLTLFGTVGLDTRVTCQNSAGMLGGTTDGQGFLWTVAGGLKLLTDLIAPATGWTTFDQVWGITDDNYIFGSGTFNGVSSDFAAKLCL